MQLFNSNHKFFIFLKICFGEHNLTNEKAMTEIMNKFEKVEFGTGYMARIKLSFDSNHEVFLIKYLYGLI